MSAPGKGPEVNKFEQVSSDDRQMSLAGEGAPCLVRFHVWRGAGGVSLSSVHPCLVVGWGHGGLVPAQ